jgi:hypothetical protein
VAQTNTVWLLGARNNQWTQPPPIPVVRVASGASIGGGGGGGVWAGK